MAVRFGRRWVGSGEHQRLIRGTFEQVAERYDIMNDAMSAGLHRAWKERLASELRPGPDQRHLDAASGTGDVAFAALLRIRQAQRKYPSEAAGSVIAADSSEGMLEAAKRRAGRARLEPAFPGEAEIAFKEADAQELPFPEGTFDSYTIAFGLRNVTDPEAALKEALRVLRHGGRALCMEFSRPESFIVRSAYNAYSEAVIPRLGSLLAGDREPYRYLVDSIRTWRSKDDLRRLFESSGFSNASYWSLFGGLVAVHQAMKL